MFKIDEGVSDLKSQLSETSNKVEEVQLDIEDMRESVRPADLCLNL